MPTWLLAGPGSVWDSAIKGKHIQVRNNLVLGGADMDLVVIDAVNAQEDRGPGKRGRLVHLGVQRPGPRRRPPVHAIERIARRSWR